MFEQLKIISLLYMIIFEVMSPLRRDFQWFQHIYTAGGPKLVFKDLIYILYIIYILQM